MCGIKLGAENNDEKNILLPAFIRKKMGGNINTCEKRFFYCPIHESGGLNIFCYANEGGFRCKITADQKHKHFLQQRMRKIKKMTVFTQQLTK